VLLGTQKGRVLFLSATYGGSIHDKAIVDEEGWQFPPAIVLHQDLGCKGFAPVGVEIQMPHKKPRTRELTDEQKQQNKQKAAIRVKIEHIIRRVKVYRIVKDRIRMVGQNIKDLVIEVASALHNFKCSYKT
jgi:DDE superfamily endonuclease